MREVITVRADRRVRTLALIGAVLFALAFAALAFAGPAAAASSAASSGSPAASPSVEPSPVTQTLTGALSRAAAVFGDEVTVGGTLTPAAADQEVTVKAGGAVVGTALTDANGAYTLSFIARRSGEVVASLTADPAVAAEPQALSVKPKVTVTHGALAPFLTSPVVVRVAPAAYGGLVVVKVAHKGASQGSWKARVTDGKATVRVPFRGVDGFTLTVVLPAAAGLDGRSVQVKVAVRAKTLSAGAKGPYVKGMLTALKQLKFRVPGIGSRFTAQVKDSVMAFQKAYGLSRTYVFNTACWRKIDGAKVIRPRYSGPSRHVEVDKRRQILMVVKDGRAFGIIAVSTGATGNTPEGTFRIQQKHPFTTSGYGGILVRTMGFIGDFAIHGYSPVPPYPASHGCIREPIWACYWVYDNSFVGETLYVYH